jgi:cation:H+ antiporter
MIQTTVPTAFGLFFTPWILDPSLIVAGAITLIAVVALYAGFRSGRMSRGWLSLMALLYAAFVGLVIALHLS